MGVRELFLVLGAVVLFGITSLSVNKTMFYTKEAVWANEFQITAIALTQQFIEEAKAKAFDEVLITNTPTGLPGTFTATGSIGPDAGEYFPFFDDIDDYNGLRTTINTPRASYLVRIEVGYINESGPDSTQSSPSFFKKMKVNVDNKLIPESTISAEYVFAYWGEVP